MTPNQKRNNAISERWSQAAGRIHAKYNRLIEFLNDRFNALPLYAKKSGILLFGAATGGLSLLLVIQALQGQGTNSITVDKIKTPKDIFMNEQSETLSDELIPIGKMKGMIEGEFEAFYVGVDRNGKVYINHDLEYSKDAYKKSNGWQSISKEKLNEYHKDLHFIPIKSKGIKKYKH